MSLNPEFDPPPLGAVVVADLPPHVETFWVNPSKKPGAAVEIVDEQTDVRIVPAGENWGGATVYAQRTQTGVRFRLTRSLANPDAPMSAVACTLSGPRDEVRKIGRALMGFDVSQTAAGVEVDRLREENTRLLDEVIRLRVRLARAGNPFPTVRVRP